MRESLCFKCLAFESQRASILRDGTHGLFRHSTGNLSLDLERYRDIGTDESNQMRDHLVRDATRIAPRTRWIEQDGSVKAPRLGRDGWPDRRGYYASSPWCCSDGAAPCRWCYGRLCFRIKLHARHTRFDQDA